MPPLTVTVSTAPLLAGGGAVALPVAKGDDGPVPGAGAAEVASALGLDLPALLTRESAKGEPGEVVAIPVARDGVDVVLLAGVGDGSPSALRKAAAAVARRARDSERLGTTLAVGGGAEAARAVAEAAALASYSFTRKSEPKPAKLSRVDLVGVGSAAQRAVDRAAVVAAAVSVARDLTNTPSLEKTPAWLAAQAERLVGAAGGTVTVRDERALAEEGFGGVLAVGAGSARPPRLIEMTWGERSAKRHVVLIGKGITFDSGGISLKPNDGMTTMKTDMAGGAAVIATMAALSAIKPAVRVTALVPAAENLISGSAQRPGDVIRHYGGRTVEVLNTDAEGRLVLADALAYADTRLAPDVMVDLATLTGAATLGLGKRHGALYATDERLARALLEAADESGERLWRMPLVDEYRPAIDSPIADLANAGNPQLHFSGGSITAALFLREFTGGRTWAHLDIAGPARADADEDEVTKGGTGYGVRTLLRWFERGA